MEPLEIISNIYGLAKAIHEQVELVKNNKEQCQRLSKRIDIVKTVLKKIEPIKNKHAYLQPLCAIEQCLNECFEYIREFSNKHILKQIFFAGFYKDRFTDLSKQLKIAIDDLNMGFNAQHLIDHQQDKLDQQKDVRDLLAQQDYVIGMYKEEQAKRQILALAEEKEKRFVLEQQEASLLMQFEALKNNQSVKPLLDPDLLIPFYELAIDKIIARGSFGTVYAGRWQEQPVAIKMIANLMPADRIQFIREVKIMSKLRGPYVTQLYKACLEPHRACLVMEYMAQGSLYDLLRQNKEKHFNLTAKERHQMMLDLACSLYFIHSQGVLHRDLKSANVLVNAQGQLKLSDFGLAKTCASSVATIQTRSHAFAWLAPELFIPNSEYTEACDIYSFGVILWEILTNERPFAKLSESQLMVRVTKGEREKLPSNLLPEYATIIEGCWQADPAKRPKLFNIIRQLESMKIKFELNTTEAMEIKIDSSSAPAGYFNEKSEITPDALYDKGHKFELQKNEKEAFDCYLRAGHRGHAAAQNKVARFLMKGLEGKKPDKVQAYNWLLKSAQQDYMAAQFNLAEMLYFGDGVNINYQEALHWYEKAERNGNQDSHKKIIKVKEKLLQTITAPSNVIF